MIDATALSYISSLNAWVAIAAFPFVVESASANTCSNSEAAWVKFFGVRANRSFSDMPHPKSVTAVTPTRKCLMKIYITLFNRLGRVNANWLYEPFLDPGLFHNRPGRSPPLDELKPDRRKYATCLIYSTCPPTDPMFPPPLCLAVIPSCG